MADPTSGYPYSNVTKTRAGWHPAWILLKDKRATGKSDIMRETCKWRALPCAYLPKFVVHLLIDTMGGLPVPQEMDNVLNCMDIWGRGTDQEWYFRVVERLATWLEEGVPRSEKTIKQVCLFLKIDKGLTALYGNQSPVVNQILNAWIDWFNTDYYYSGGQQGGQHFANSNDFFYLSLRSFHYVQSLTSNTPAN